MTRPAFEALGFDPAPGSLDLLDITARDVRNTVRALGEVESILTSDRDGEWVGKAAEAFREMVGEELAPRVTTAYQSFDGASRALTDWISQLEDYQSRADRLEERARVARENVASAQSAVDGQPDVDDSAPDADEARDRLTLLQGRVGTANSELDAVMSDARSLCDEVEGAASDTAGRIEASAGSAPDEPGLFERIGNAIKDMATFILDEFAWLIEALEAILPYLVFALAIVAMFVPGLNALVIGLAISMIAIDTLQAIDGRGSWGDVVLGVAMLGAGAGFGAMASRFASASGNAFRITIGGPGLASATGGIVPGTAVAALRFSPNIFNMAALGTSISKVGEALTSMPSTMWPTWPPGSRR